MEVLDRTEDSGQVLKQGRFVLGIIESNFPSEDE